MVSFFTWLLFAYCLKFIRIVKKNQKRFIWCDYYYLISVHQCNYKCIIQDIKVFQFESPLYAWNIAYCGIIRIRGGSIFVEFVGTPHPRSYILNEIISTMFIEHLNEKKKWYASMYRINSVNNQIITPFFRSSS